MVKWCVASGSIIVLMGPISTCKLKHLIHLTVRRINAWIDHVPVTSISQNGFNLNWKRERNNYWERLFLVIGQIISLAVCISKCKFLLITAAVWWECHVVRILVCQYFSCNDFIWPSSYMSDPVNVSQFVHLPVTLQTLSEKFSCK